MTASIQVLPDLVVPGAELYIIVSDYMANNDPNKIETVLVDVKTDAKNDRRRVTSIDNLRLIETDKNTGVFVGELKLTPDRRSIPGDLEVLPGDLVSIRYKTFELSQGKLSPVVISKVIEIAAFDPEFAVDKERYNVGDSVSVTISDPGANLDPGNRDYIQLLVSSRTDPYGVQIKALESGVNTGVFTATFGLTKAESTSKSIRIATPDEVTIAYVSTFPADYADRIKESKDPRKVFFFTIPIGQPTDLQEILDHMQKYFDPLIFDKIIKSGILPSTNKTITIAFWDIRKFSAMVESLRTNPEMVVNFLKDYFDLATDVVSRNGGILDKFMGDGVMALFGVFSEDQKESAIAAVNAALDFKAGFIELLKKWKPKWEEAEEQAIEIELGCGINTGEVIVGVIGGQNRQQFTAIGRAVNIASRLESKSEGNRILISGRTVEKVKEEFMMRHLANVTLKNIPGKYRRYEVISKAKPLRKN